MKKILTFCLVLLLCMFPTTMLSGCDVTQNTKDAIDTTTSILPYEFSQSLAQGILANACAFSTNEKSIKSDYLKQTYTFAGFKADSDVSATSVYLDQNGNITEKMEMSMMGLVYLKAYSISVQQSDKSYKYYSLLESGEIKLYKEIARNTYGQYGVKNDTSYSSVYGGKMNLSGLIITSQDDGQVRVESMLDHVIGGRYFEGKTYINAHYEYSGAWGSEFSEKKGFDVEYVIANNKIYSITILQRHKSYSKGEDGISNTEDDVFDAQWNIVETFVYNYEKQSILDVPTSIDGYEYGEWATSTIIG